MNKIGFIGTGNMGTALLTGARKAFDADRFIFFDRNADKRERITGQLGISPAADVTEVARESGILFLMVKPQNYAEVIDQIKDELREDHIVISVAPGVTRAWIRRQAGVDLRVVRAMPNTPSLIGAGMTGLAYDEGMLSDEESDVIMRIFGSCGEVRRVDESLMDTVICASGSSPAFYYLFIDAIAKRCEDLGMTREDAVTFAAQTADGSGQMVLQAEEDPATLAERVCSKGGTTIEGVTSLKADNLDSIVARAVDATFAKAQAMRRE